jgi:hypothetical protein
MAPNGPAQTGDHDWTVQVADRIESVVETVRDKTTKPATLVARGLVYGLVAGVLGAALLFLLVLGLTRVLDVYLPFHPIGRRVWVVDAGAAAIFLGSGAFLWRRRRPKSV